jgi:hypothetical protein
MVAVVFAPPTPRENWWEKRGPRRWINILVGVVLALLLLVVSPTPLQEDEGPSTARREMAQRDECQPIYLTADDGRTILTADDGVTRLTVGCQEARNGAAGALRGPPIR